MMATHDTLLTPAFPSPHSSRSHSTQYLVSSGSEGLSGVGFVYGIPILLIGLSLQYAQLNPVPVEVRERMKEMESQKRSSKRATK